MRHYTNVSEVFVPAIAIGELYFGAYKSQRAGENIARIDEFVLNNSVLDCNAATARRYGDIKNRLKEKGQPLPENDIWIAAIAQEYDLTLATRDTHFQIIEAKEAIQLWIDTAKEFGDSVPDPKGHRLMYA